MLWRGPSRGQLGQPGKIAFAPNRHREFYSKCRTREALAAADSSRKRGHQPPLAGFLARRQGGAFYCLKECHNSTDAQVAVQSVGTGERRNLIQEGRNPATRPPGTWFMRKLGT